MHIKQNIGPNADDETRPIIYSLSSRSSKDFSVFGTGSAFLSSDIVGIFVNEVNLKNARTNNIFRSYDKYDT